MKTDRYLLAVGGTGQEVAAAVLRLCHMGNMDPPSIIVVDGDQASAKQVFQSRSQTLRQLGEAMKHRFRPSIVEFHDPFDKEGHDSVYFLTDLFKGGGGIVPRDAQLLLDALTTKRQQAVRIQDGFHGHPHVASLAFSDAMSSGKALGELLADLETLLNVGNDVYVCFAGSTTGGTGPGVIPPLAKYLQGWRERHARRTVHINGLIHAPWFRNQKMVDEGYDVAPDVTEYISERNSSCLAKLYSMADNATGLGGHFDRLVMLGLPELVRRASSGPSVQPETLHYMNIVSGSLALRLLCGSGEKAFKDSKSRLWGFSLRKHAELDQLTLCEDRKEALSLRMAADTTRAMVRLGALLRAQNVLLGPDMSHPSALRSVLDQVKRRSLDSEVFWRAFMTLVELDEQCLDWLRDAAAAVVPGQGGAMERADTRALFELAPDELATGIESVAGIYRSRTYRDILDRVFQNIAIDAEGPSVGLDAPQAAVELYKKVRERVEEMARKRQVQASVGEAVALLPLAAESDAHAAPQAQHNADLWSIEAAELDRHLIKAERLHPEGIPDPLSWLCYQKWMLAERKTASGRAHAERLQAVILASFLGQLDSQEALRSPQAQRILSAVRATHESSQVEPLLLWTDRDAPDRAVAFSLPAARFVVAAALTPEFTEPGDNRAQENDPLKELMGHLLSRFGPNSSTPLLDDGGAVSSKVLAAQLSGYLADLGESASGDDDFRAFCDAWMEELAERAPRQQRGSEVGTFPGTTAAKICQFVALPEERWTCGPDSDADLSFWRHPKELRIALDTKQILHPELERTLQKANGVEVGIEDFGVVDVHRPERDKVERIVWADPSSDPVGTTSCELDCELGLAGKIVRVINGRRVVAEGLLLAPSMVLLTPAQTSSGGATMPIPISSDWLGLLDEQRHPKYDSVSGMWEVFLRGRAVSVKVPVDSPGHPIWQEAGILAWPKQGLGNWRVGLGVGTTLGSGGGVAYRLVGREESKNDGPSRIKRSQIVPPDRVVEAPFAPRFVELMTGDTSEGGGAVWKSRGLTPIMQKSLPTKRDRTASLFLDIGTRNTALLAVIETGGYQERDAESFLPSGYASEDHVHESAAVLQLDAVNLGPLLANIEDGLATFTTWNLDLEPLNFVPSWLLDRACGDTERAYSVPSRNTQGALNAQGCELYENLKWNRPRGALGASVLTKYIQRVMLPILHKLALSSVGTVRTYVTYPLAFTSQQFKDFEDILRGALRDVLAATGMQQPSSDDAVVFVSESEAGIYAVQTSPNLSYILTVDMGGGSTDIALFSVGHAGHPTRYLAVDSVRLAGDTLLKAVAHKLPPETLKEHLDIPQAEAENPAAVLSHLDRRIHTGGADFLNRLLSAEPMYAARVFRAWDAILGGLLVYLGRIITANIPSDAPKGKIGISLLGQAWMLLDSTFYEPRGIVGASLAKQLSTLLPAGWEVDFNLVSDTDKKTAIVQGVRKLRAQSANVVKFAGQPKTGYCNVKWTILGVPAHNEHKKQFAADSVLKTIDSDSPIGLAEGFETARALLKDVRGCLHEPTDFDKFLALPTDGGAPYRELLEKEIAAGLNRAFKEVTAENATVVASSPLARYIESGWAEEWVRRNPWNRG